MNFRSPSWAGALALALALPAAAQTRQLCTINPFASNNGLSGTCIVFFDLTVNIPVIIQSLDTNSNATAATPITLQMWTTPGTYVGVETTPAAWTQVAQDAGGVLAAGRNLVTNVPFAAPLLLQPGTYGVALTTDGGHAYTNGTGANQNFSNADMAIALGKSASYSAATGPFTGSPITPRVWNGCINYIPGNGLYPGFTATPTSGTSPLNVQFTDQTFTSDPNGLTSWAWDVDGDNLVDYTTQNPSHTYAAGGKYTVTLTVTDGLFGTRSLTKTDYVVVDPIHADFTATPVFGALPLLVQFSDTTTGNPIAWLWDFDNDGTVDSTAQNPVWTYTTAGRFTVTMRTTNGANADSITKTDLITVVGPTNNTRSAEILEFQFNEPRGSNVANTASTTTAPSFATVGLAGSPNSAWQGDPGRMAFMGNDPGTGCMAADNVTPYEARVDTGWPVDITGSHTVMFWTRIQTATNYGYAFGSTAGSARCYHDGSHWSLRSWGSLGSSYPVSGSNPMSLTGWNHWAIVIDDAAGTAQWYLNGVADGTPLSFTPNTFVMQNTFGNLTIGGYSSSSYFGRYADIDDFRLYGNALTQAQIAAAMASENPATSTFGAGCSGPSAVPTIGATGGAPAVNNASFALSVGNLEAGVPQVVNIGIFPMTTGLPLDLSLFLGATYTGCNAELFPDFVGIGLGGSSSAVVALPIPNDPNLAGWHLYAQAIALGSQGAVSPALDINMQL